MKLEAMFDKIADARVAVIGDVCIDAYVFVSDGKSEVSVETGLATRSVERFTFDLGGAGNVAMNVKRLGAEKVDLFGVIGADAYGDMATGILRREGIGTGGLAVQGPGWDTHVYCKVYSGGQEEPRLDYGNFNVPGEESIAMLLERLEGGLAEYGAVVVNQQVLSGFQDERFQRGLLEVMSRRPAGQAWICDCRSLNDVYKDCVHKLNAAEARRICAIVLGESAVAGLSDEAVAERLFARWGKPVVVTRGQDGAVVFDGVSATRILGLHVIDRIDAVGAGDAFLAAAAACVASGAAIADAAELGNLAAGVSITRIHQTGHPSPEDILKIGASPDYRYSPELAADPRLGERLPGTEIEIIARPPPAVPQAAVFDHDGTISTLRQGWEEIMSGVMIRCVLGKALGSVSTQVYASVESAVRSLIDRTTGVQTLVQMRALCRLVADFGYTDRIATPAEYKAMYNAELLEMVDARLARVRSGALCAEDYTVKGSIAFLRRLHDAGTTLYLASGTDEADLRREAEALGYADFFGGGIRGAVGDIDRDPKRLVLESILGGLDAQGRARCAVFGDGPVEMREARKRGATAIGVASDESRRHGMNPAKRSRLVLGGAQAIIPDFSWSAELLAWLGWEPRS
jgi:bifunctional ADP-heptose synthase (sugar kinase/adenylyltransferase)/phosphoglycolate phosphatase-like HAD superfamily hydrolase